jgi:hypothetical protein
MALPHGHYHGHYLLLYSLQHRSEPITIGESVWMECIVELAIKEQCGYAVVPSCDPREDRVQE